ncbi:hypothetical protein GE061_018302 [Apolygus lucorum]|uniref:Protein takeout n=1 Tax=Apolygus lucorum TaxID=248454 RepID=A0A6A4J513_APOLU|nr:hypothetical protein GE061_018302 [Apolygus lucorum]
MLNVLSAILAAWLIIGDSHQLKLPSYIKACKRTDPKLNECVVKAGRAAIPKFINGDTKYRVPRLDPLEISELKVHQGGSRALGINMSLKDSKVTGLKSALFQAARTDLKNKHIEWDFFHPYLTIIGKYDITGQVLLLPVRGSGTSNITLTNMKSVFKFDFVLETRADGLEYMKVTNTRLDTDIGKAYFRFNNLFNGDRLLGESMNRFINENSREVIKELGAPVIDSVSQVFEIILASICELVPYSLVYPENEPQDLERGVKSAEAFRNIFKKPQHIYGKLSIV